jgi:uncharacterized membrane protein
MADSQQGQRTDERRQQPTDQGPGGTGDVPEERRGEQVAAQHGAHGQSVASWTAVGLIMLGALIMAIAVVVTTVWLFVVGIVVVIAGAVAGKVLSMMGFGVSGKPGH